MTENDALVCKLEETEVGCLELSANMLLAFGWTANKGQSVWHLPDGTLYGPAHGAGFMPDPTSSLDEALELAGVFWMAALLYALGRAASYFVNFADKGDWIKKKVILWVCIAALKARNTA